VALREERTEGLTTKAPRSEGWLWNGSVIALCLCGEKRTGGLTTKAPRSEEEHGSEGSSLPPVRMIGLVGPDFLSSTRARWIPNLCGSASQRETSGAGSIHSRSKAQRREDISCIIALCLCVFVVRRGLRD
jgi:hypothetical protein